MGDLAADTAEYRSFEQPHAPRSHNDQIGLAYGSNRKIALAAKPSSRSFSTSNEDRPKCSRASAMITCPSFIRRATRLLYSVESLKPEVRVNACTRLGFDQKHSAIA
jgi:hypothetical protein